MSAGTEGRAGASNDAELQASMLDALDHLLAALVLEPVGEDRFSVHAEAGQFEDRLFGGQLLAQAMVAAGATVDGQDPQSLHAYFVGAGNPRQPLALEVQRVRDGRSISTRYVTITQGDRKLLTALASFHTNPMDPGWDGPVSSPSSPERLPLLQDWAHALPPDLAEHGRSWIERPPPFEIRIAEAPSFLGGASTESVRQHWMRLPRPVDDDPLLQAALLAHASDYLVLDMVLRARPQGAGRDLVRAVSLDHSLWIHRPVHVDRWHRCTQEIVARSGHRGLARSSIHDEHGHLVASVVQEGLVRPASSRPAEDGPDPTDHPWPADASETTMTHPVTPAPRPRRGISFFGPPAEAPGLQDTDMMSMPVIDPPASEQFRELVQGGGNAVKVLYRDGDMSLVWSWLAPNYLLPRHSHSADCLYFVVSGEARLGSRTVSAGAGFFVPAGAPYAYSAGPEGIQILEFRGATSFDMKITESLGRWDEIVQTVRSNRDAWSEEAASHGHPLRGAAG